MNHDNERKAFEEWIKNEDPFIGNDDNPDCIWAKKYMWKAWLASANRQGYKLVPVEPTDEMINTYRDKSIAPISTLSVCGYKAMIGACDE